MRKQADNANRYLVHKVRNSLAHLKLIHRELKKVSLEIERALNLYREMIDEVVEQYENIISNGKNTKDE